MRCLVMSPEATFDYSVAWPRAKLLGVAITEAEWASAPAGLAILPHAAEPRRSGATIGGGVPGRRYRLTHRVTLADDRTLSRTLDIEVAR